MPQNDRKPVQVVHLRRPFKLAKHQPVINQPAVAASVRIHAPAPGTPQASWSDNTQIGYTANKLVPNSALCEAGETISVAVLQDKTPAQTARVLRPTNESDERALNPRGLSVPQPCEASGNSPVLPKSQSGEAAARAAGEAVPKSRRAAPKAAVPVNAYTSRAELPGLLNEKEVAVLLGLKPATLRNWRVKGLGPAWLQVSRRAVRYQRANVDEWLASRARRSTSQTEDDND